SLIKRNEPFLRSDLFSWGWVGHLFSKILDDKGVVRWLTDWRDRPDAEGWMLINLALALHGLKRWDDALEVHRAAAEEHPDYTQRYHETWCALGAAIKGDLDAAQAFFDSHEIEDLDSNHQWIAALTKAVMTALTTHDKTRALAKARKII